MGLYLMIGIKEQIVELKDSIKYCFNTDLYVLDGISFRIEQGEKVAVVGINGAGKSTLIKLLLRFYDVTDGAISINNINIREYKLQSIRRNFSVYFRFGNPSRIYIWVFCQTGRSLPCPSYNQCSLA